MVLHRPFETTPQKGAKKKPPDFVSMMIEMERVELYLLTVHLYRQLPSAFALFAPFCGHFS
jgi:hypothetical protein